MNKNSIFSSNSCIIFLLFLIVTLLSVFYEIPTIEYGCNCGNILNIEQLKQKI